MRSDFAAFVGEMARFALITLAIVLPIRIFIAEPFIVSGASMEPTFETNDYLIVDRLTYRFEEPKRGDVVIFKYPKDPSKYFIKRVIGLPGDTVVLSGTGVTIKNSAHPEGFSIEQPYVVFGQAEDRSFVVGPDEFFVMGDNRAASLDSRAWGDLPAQNIVGRALVRLFPPNEFSLFPGAIETSQ